MTKEAIERLVRRGRSRLEAMRFLRAAARGTLAGGALGLVALTAQKLGLSIPAWAPWSLPAAGAVGGLLAAALAPRVPLVSAALYLDERLDTQERLATIVTRDPGRFGPRILAELEGVRRLPRVPLPREFSLVPAALFLLFAVGLLPSANSESGLEADPGREETAPAGALREARATRAPDVSKAVARLARGDTPDATDVAGLRRAVEEAVFSPEQRRTALSELKRAAAGDGDAAKRVAKILKAALGGAGSGDTGEPKPDGAVLNAGGRGGATVTVYPKHRELVLAYRRALAEEKSR